MAAALSVLLAVAFMAYAWAGRPLPREDTGSVPFSASEVVQALLECVRMTDAAEISANRPALECTATVMRRVRDVRGLVALDQGLLRAERVDARLIMLCHSEGHAVAREGYLALEDASPGTGLRALLDVFKQEEQGCHGAVSHGTLEGWVASGPSRAGLSELVSQCEALASGGDAPVKSRWQAGRCADGLGHAIWSLYGSAEPCSEFRMAELQHGCSGGIVMQYFHPVGQAEPTPGVTFDMLVDLCENRWPASVAVRGCYMGVAYAFQRPFSKAVAEQTVGYPAGGSLPQDRRDRILQGLDESLSWCSRLVSDTERWCHEQLVFSDAVVGLEESFVRQICAQLVERAERACIDRFVPRLVKTAPSEVSS